MGDGPSVAPGRSDAPPRTTAAANLGVDIVKVAAILAANRRRILRTVIVGTVLALPILLLLPSEYTSEARFIPAAPAASSSIAALSGLASSVGLLQGAPGTPDFYADVATSTSLLRRVIRTPLVLDTVAHKPVIADYATAVRITKDDPLERTDEALKHLADNMDVTVNHASGIVTVDVSAHSPGLAYQLAQAVLDAINDFNVHSLQTMGRAQRVFDEQRVRLATDSLNDARDTLEAFYEANRGFASSPALVMEESVLKQNLQLREQVYTAAVTDLQAARVSEINDTPVLTTVEQPDIPVKTSGPHRLLLLLGVMVLLTAFAAVRALFGEFSRYLHATRPEDFGVLESAFRTLDHVARHPLFPRSTSHADRGSGASR